MLREAQLDSEQKELLALYRIGMIPGPNESLAGLHHRFEDFQRRRRGGYTIDPFSQKVGFLLKELFDLPPTQIPIHYSRQGLFLWEGAATWIDEAGSVVRIQLKPRLKKSNRWLKLYDQNEILAHELIHVARSAFNEPIYEEFFAYMSSSLRYRRWLGPLLRRPAEGVVLILSALLAPLGSLLLALPLFILSTGLLSRLFLRHRRLNQCLRVLSEVTQCARKARAIALLLTDYEIDAFAHSSSLEIVEYALREEECSARWRLISLLYFSAEES